MTDYRAKTLKDAFRLCNVDPLSGEGLERYYVDLADVRKTEAIDGVSTILDFQEPGEFTTILFTGHRGCGKSTELKRICSQLDQDYRVIYLEVNEETDINDAEYTDLYLIVIKQVEFALRQEGLRLDPRLLKNFEDWFKDITEENERTVASSISVEAESSLKGEAPFLAKLLVKLLAQIKGADKRKTTIRQILQRNISRLKADINLLLKDGFDKIKSKYPKGFLVIFDNLDRVPPAVGNHLFLDYAAQLQDLPCTIVYTVPISVLSSAKNITNTFGEPHVVSMVEIYKLERDRVELEYNSAGLDKLKSILGARIDIDLLFESETEVLMLAKASGGHVRQLMQMVRSATQAASTRKHAKIQAEDVEYAIKQQQFNFERFVPDEHYPLLAKVCLTKNVTKDETGQLMLFNTSVLEYDRLERWNYPNPVVRQSVLFQAALKKLQQHSENVVLSKIEIENIRCFQNISIDFEVDKSPNHWMMILGDNAVGKSTLLKSIALGLCDESDAIALIKEMPGEFLREGTKEGSIKIQLCEDTPSKQPKKYTITTKITKNSEDSPEIIRQETIPAKNFPWQDIFVCAYGSNRSNQSDRSYEQYKVIDAVRSLFDPQTSLQNPEVILLRQDPISQSILEEKLKQILMLDPDDLIYYTKRGLEVDGPWGRLPLQVLSDGYRITTQWVLDFIGWLIHAERLMDNPDIGGILLIDELEQHLHPRWQRHIVKQLRRQFPKTQIIASTHTPLVAAGIADIDDSMLLKLERNYEDRQISLRIIDKTQITGKRADQILTSEAFDLITTRNARSHDDIDRYTELLGKTVRTETEETELAELRSIVQSRFNNSENPTAQLVEKAVDEALQATLTNISPEVLDVETKKQLRALFQSEN